MNWSLLGGIAFALLSLLVLVWVLRLWRWRRTLGLVFGADVAGLAATRRARRRRSLGAVGALVLAVAGGLAVSVAPPAGADTVCAPEIVVGVDGTGAVGDPNSIVRQHTDAAAAAGAEVHMIDYPGAVWPLGPFVLDQSAAAGVDETRATITRLRADCPGSHLTVIGQSQGALVAGDAVESMALDGVDTSGMTVVLLSDPRRDGGVAALLPTPLPGYTFAGPRGDMGGADVVQVCRPNDPICDFPGLLELWRVPGDFAAHHGDYPVGYYDEPAADPVPAPMPDVELPAIEWPALPELPPLPNLTDPYIERPLGLYVPDALKPFVPAPVLDYVPPPAPCIPFLTCH